MPSTQSLQKSFSDVIICEATENCISKSILKEYFWITKYNITKSMSLWHKNAHTMKFKVVFIWTFTFVVFCCYEAGVTLRFHDLVLISSYLSCFCQVFTQLRMITLMFLFSLFGLPFFCEFPFSLNLPFPD